MGWLVGGSWLLVFLLFYSRSLAVSWIWIFILPFHISISFIMLVLALFIGIGLSLCLCLSGIFYLILWLSLCFMWFCSDISRLG